jgi:hypothetical protein
MHDSSPLPPLAYAEWVDTKDTLHLFLQMIGKVRLKAHPKLNHWWHVTLYPTTRGLTTDRIPWQGSGFAIDFDMLDHEVRVTRSDGRLERFAVPGKTVAAFHEALFAALRALDVEVAIVGVPYENKSTVPFAEDHAPRAYDGAAVTRFWSVLCATASIFEVWRGRFAGKQTPVHFFWHSFDLVVTRFSGRSHPLANATTQANREAYSHEVISVGFWLGDDTFPYPAFYGYAYPEPAGLSAVPLQPAAASWSDRGGSALAVLPYEAWRRSADRRAELLSFLDSVYQGAGQLGGWPLAALLHEFRGA